MRKVQNMTVVSQKLIAKNVYEIILSGNLVQGMLQAGQFVNIKINEVAYPLLRRPISICEINQELNQFKMIYRAEGEGTKLLSQKQAGEQVDILGPLGTGFDIEDVQANETVVLVGGGIGVPPMYEMAKRLHAKGNKVITVLGFASSVDVFYEEEFKAYADVYITTMDGSHGYKGNVVELINDKQLNFDWIYGCGPKVMLKAIDEQFGQTKKGYLSFEERMACGIGACYACVCQLNSGKMARVCKEGPVFKLGEVAL
ncbi:MAG: dihydroorotate dehydrogenase electron transfer subunit [Turicibacter sp.]|nr:dihydroorotate dehydrogenase electron transfer subunit [Turicibacter sp.]